MRQNYFHIMYITPLVPLMAHDNASLKSRNAADQFFVYTIQTSIVFVLDIQYLRCKSNLYKLKRPITLKMTDYAKKRPITLKTEQLNSLYRELNAPVSRNNVKK